MKLDSLLPRWSCNPPLIQGKGVISYASTTYGKLSSKLHWHHVEEDQFQACLTERSDVVSTRKEPHQLIHKVQMTAQLHTSRSVWFLAAIKEEMHVFQICVTNISWDKDIKTITKSCNRDRPSSSCC